MTNESRRSSNGKSPLEIDLENESSRRKKMASEGPLKAILGDSLKLQDYIWTDDANDRPALAHDAFNASTDTIPCIDLSAFRGASSSDRRQQLEAFRRAVSEWGFFQVVGHGVSEEIMKEALALSRTVFEMPLERKLRAAVVRKVGETPAYGCGLKSADVSRRVWRESLHSWTDPEDFKAVAEMLWPEGGDVDKIKDVHYKYTVAIEELAMELLQLLEESLGLKPMEFSQHWEPFKRTVLRFTHYPPCAQPTLVTGVSSHTDPSLITILYQDNVGGLQILKDDEWIAVKPRYDSFVVNIGDCLQAFSNDIFPSVQHRVALNTHTSRMSIVAFVFPKNGTVMQPSAGLVDAKHPALFKAFTFEELAKAARENNYNGKHALQLFRRE